MSNTYDISIVIVNYNVRHFVVECLESYRRSKLANLTTEVWIVDNASIDGSVEVIREQYPEVKLIANRDNVGFSTANNQAIRKAKGKYILLLNPDTVLEEDTLKICFDYMEAHAKVGALGVKMIDGAGIFLPESKRALPTAWNSFTKLVGLSTVFSKSKLFNGYALGHLSETERHQIEVLCGAFMFMPKATLDQVGLLDERFFMYGEDIDLSYRIVKGGYEVHYIPDTTIIHYKGESTKKGSLNYVKTFYNAMGLYVDKHYGEGFSFFGSLLKLGIWTRASISIARRLVTSLLPLLVDILLISAGLYLFSQLWATYYFNDAEYYGGTSLSWNIGLYSLLWVFTAWILGYYKKVKWTKRLQSVIIGTVVILGIYGLLDESYRTSRVLILAGAGISFLIYTITSLLKNILSPSSKTKNILIVAKEKRAKDIQKQLVESAVDSDIVGLVYPQENDYDRNIYVNKVSNLPQLSRVLKADEIIFSTEDMSTKEIMKTMMNLDARLSFKIAGDESLNILGSKSKNTSGEIYDIDLKYNLSTEYHRHLKRMFDIVVSIFFLLLFPITLVAYRLNLASWLRTWTSIMVGSKTWIGYNEDQDSKNLPIIPQSIYKTKNNRNYARHYTVWRDLEILKSNIFNI